LCCGVWPRKTCANIDEVSDQTALADSSVFAQIFLFAGAHRWLMGHPTDDEVSDQKAFADSSSFVRLFLFAAARHNDGMSGSALRVADGSLRFPTHAPTTPSDKERPLGTPARAHEWATRMLMKAAIQMRLPIHPCLRKSSSFAGNADSFAALRNDNKKTKANTGVSPLRPIRLTTFAQGLRSR
jgi:hypothetical protein